MKYFPDIRKKLYEIIFGTDSFAGKFFDIFLLWCIVISVITVMLESVSAIRINHATVLRTIEWMFTILFTVEYGLRLFCSPRPIQYARSFFGIVDLLAVMPTYISLIIVGAQPLIVIRALRLLRIFRILKLGQFLGEAKILRRALAASLPKITVFLSAILTVTIIIGTIMYMIEGAVNGFTSIPKSIYWAIVTMTTVGYGDIAPQTVLGQFLASVLMLVGYSIIAIPTGIVSVEFAHEYRKEAPIITCPACASKGHGTDAKHCKYCGAVLKITDYGMSPKKIL